MDDSENNVTPENKPEASPSEPAPSGSPDIPSLDNKVENEDQSTEDLELVDHLKNSLSLEVTDPMYLEAIFDVPVQVSAVLGRASMPVNKLLKLGRGAVIELDRRIGEAIDIYVNNLLVARGEVVVVEDRLGITMTQIIKTTHK